ncbi:MAG: proline racemase family protein [Chloroflexi bacterium]|nr:proline racemase family protein [Chloroflexota bacterium]
MEIRHVYTTIDSHTAGEPLRIVTGGVPPIPGETILARRAYARNKLDHIRRALMREPRGHPDMYGCFITPPVSPESDLGVIFMHNEGYSTMCGHGIIALTTAALETGLLPAVEPVTEVALDTPAGLVRARAEVAGGRVRQVTFQNVPSFVFAHDLEVEVPGCGDVRIDVVYGGAFYAVAPANMAIRPANAGRLIDLGMRIKRAVEARLDARHHEQPEICGIYGTILTGPPDLLGSDARNVTIFADGQVDRSPCGTGTSGRLAALHAAGQVPVGRPYVNESILGTRFTGRIVGTCRSGPYPAIIPEVSGSAHITGFQQFIVDPADPLQDGFLVIPT